MRRFIFEGIMSANMSVRRPCVSVTPSLTHWLTVPQPYSTTLIGTAVRLFPIYTSFVVSERAVSSLVAMASRVRGIARALIASLLLVCSGCLLFPCASAHQQVGVLVSLFLPVYTEVYGVYSALGQSCHDDHPLSTRRGPTSRRRVRTCVSWVVYTIGFEGGVPRLACHTPSSSVVCLRNMHDISCLRVAGHVSWRWL